MEMIVNTRKIKRFTFFLVFYVYLGFKILKCILHYTNGLGFTTPGINVILLFYYLTLHTFEKYFEFIIDIFNNRSMSLCCWIYVIYFLRLIFIIKVHFKGLFILFMVKCLKVRQLRGLLSDKDYKLQDRKDC